MRTRLTLISALVATALVFGAAAGSAKTTKPKGKKVTCTSQTFNQSNGKSTGYDLGFVQCPAPYGKGLAYTTYTETVASSKATDTGKLALYLPLGTVHGTYSVSGTIVPPPGTTTLAGPAKITGGTGKYKGAKGTGTLTCSTPDLGTHISCKAVIKVTHT